MENEIWKGIKGAKYYQVSSFGRVKSLKRDCARGGQCKEDVLLTPSKSYGGKLIVYIVGDEKSGTRSLASLVFEAFHHAKNVRDYVYYLDKDPTNCASSNLTLDKSYSTRKKIGEGSSFYKGLPVEWEDEFIKLCKNPFVTKIDLKDRFEIPTLNIVKEIIKYLEVKHKEVLWGTF